MSLLVSKVPRSLETKARLFGFELGDLLVIFLYLAVSNPHFRNYAIEVPRSLGSGTVALAAGLYFLKKGKPDQYIQHYGEHLRTPGILTANVADTNYRPYGPLNHTEEE